MVWPSANDPVTNPNAYTRISTLWIKALKNEAEHPDDLGIISATDEYIVLIEAATVDGSFAGFGAF